MQWPNDVQSTTIQELIGKSFASVVNVDNHTMRFSGEKTYEFSHFQDCCESVSIEDIEGDLSDLENSPILVAEEVSCRSGEDEANDLYGTWTFYKFATVKGYVTVRWLGSSNGYYSESVDFSEVKQ